MEEEFFLSFGFLETSKRCFVFVYPEELGLRMERKNSLVNAKSNIAEEESFEEKNNSC